MSHRNELKPTPHLHKLKRRPYYHDIRGQLAGLREHLTGGVFRAAAPPPDLVDWTAGVPPVRDQGQLGVCYGFQDRNVRMLAHWLATGQAMQDDLSPGFAAWNGRQIEGSVDNVNAGCSIGDSLQGMEDAGICTETLYPYVVQDPSAEVTRPSLGAFADALTRRVELQAVQVAIGYDAIHQVLADRHPVIFGFSVPESFEHCPSTGLLPDDPGPGSLGGHAQSFCASRLSTQTLRAVNSWGLGWGLNGTSYWGAKWLDMVWECWTVCPVS